MSSPSVEVLVAVLSNPPTTSGDRTMARLEKLRRILGAKKVEIANVFPIPTFQTRGISDVGATAEVWQTSRLRMQQAIDGASIVLWGYGVDAPAGAARDQFRGQIRWATGQCEIAKIPTVTVGGRPLHPTRWQRHTAKTFPGVQFDEALLRSLQFSDRRLMIHRGALDSST